jgi:hypothetical protein
VALGRDMLIARVMPIGEEEKRGKEIAMRVAACEECRYGGAAARGPVGESPGDFGGRGIGD